MRATRRTMALLMLLTLQPIGHAAGVVYCGTQRWQPFITEAAARFQIPPLWLAGLIRIESAGCLTAYDRPTQSPAGALGLTQLMPEVWSRFRQRLKLGSDPHDPHDNILAGTAYLHELSNRYGWPGAFAAYHAGPSRFEQYRDGLRPLPESTVEYLRRLESVLGLSMDALSGAAVFVSRKLDAGTSDRFVQESLHRPLFVTLHHDQAPSKKSFSENADEQSD